MTLTKHANEIAVKTHFGLDENAKVIENNTETVCEEALIVCDATVKHIPKSAPKIIPVETRVESLQGNLDKALHKLYDLDQSGEPKKTLNLDLDLYQMENY